MEPVEHRVERLRDSARLEHKYSGSHGRYLSQTEEPSILRCVRSGTRYALDLGTGTGRIAFLCAVRSSFTLGVDVDFRGLRVARGNASPETRVAFAAMDGAALGLRSESLDLVTAVGTFECTADLRPILREIARVLAPQGEIVFTCWNFDRWPKCDLMDRRAPGSVLWTAREVQSQAEESGLAIMDIASIFFVPRRLLWWLYRLLLIEPLRRTLVTLSVMLEGRLGSMSPFAMGGRVLVVRAGKTRGTERTYQLR
jgi:SAM-dependent methyltransferase